MSLRGHPGSVVGVGCDALGTQPVPSFLTHSPGCVQHRPARPGPTPRTGSASFRCLGPPLSSARRGRIRRSWEPVVPAEGSASGPSSWAPRAGMSMAEGAGGAGGPPALDRLEPTWVTALGV